MGYEPVKLNVAEPHVNIKLVNSDMSAGTEGYVVVTLDETSGIRYKISLYICNLRFFDIAP